MRFAIEFSEASLLDLELVFEHLYSSYVGFGEQPDMAAERAARRIVEIRRAADRLGVAPFRGTSREDVGPGVRFLTIDRAIYWFDVDEAAQKVRVLAIFLGGQDHIRRMLLRLLRDPTG